MHTYKQLTQLARMCAANARLATRDDTARQLWNMANEYRDQARALDSRQAINIGSKPALLREE